MTKSFPETQAAARAVAVKLGFDPGRIELCDDERQVELNGRTYQYAAVCDGAAIVLYARYVIPETATGIAAHAITHNKFTKFLANSGGRVDYAGRYEGVTECSRRYWQAHARRRIDASGAAANMLAEMARIKVETNKLPGSRDWRELYRLVDKGFE